MESKVPDLSGTPLGDLEDAGQDAAVKRVLRDDPKVAPKRAITFSSSI